MKHRLYKHSTTEFRNNTLFPRTLLERVRCKFAFTKPSRGMSEAKGEGKSTETLSFRSLPERCRFLRGAAFTLAEILITLGIIGVVAAITMPTLIQNYKKQVYVNQLKKTVSTLEQGFQKMLADEGVDRLSDLSYWKDYITWDNETQARLFIDNVLNKSFSNVIYNKQPNYVILSGINYHEDEYNNHMQFADGSTIVAIIAEGNFTVNTAICKQIKSLGGNLCSAAAGQILVDINGTKGPNKFGRDIFNFILSNEGKLYPQGGKDYALYRNINAIESNSYYWKNGESNGDCGSYSICACSDTDEEKRGACAARIIENGWKMDY